MTNLADASRGLADPTPIPAGALYAALDAYRAHQPGGADINESAKKMVVEAVVIAAAPILLAAGRTAAAADALMAARDDLVGVAERLRTKARDTGDKTHHGTAAGVSLACFRLVELADRAARVAENGADRP